MAYSKTTKLMTPETLTALYVTLRRRKSSNSAQWTDANNEEIQNDYAIVLLDKPDAIGRWLLLEIPRRFTWRPEPAELHELVLGKMNRLAPTASESFARLCDLRRRYGPYGQEDPDRPGVWRMGEPIEVQQSPILSKVIDSLGGWVHVCNDGNPSALRAHFTASHERIVTRENFQTLESTELEVVVPMLPAPKPCTKIIIVESSDPYYDN